MNRAATIAMLCVATLVLLGCGDSNPLIGKWVPAKGQGECEPIVSLEFTEKTMRITAPSIPDEPAPVVYSHDGTRHIVTVQVGNKKSFTFEKTADGLNMLEPVACRFVKAAAAASKSGGTKAANSNPLVGKWKSETKSIPCDMLGTIEFTEKMVIMALGSGLVTYTQDGPRYVAATADGRAFVFEKSGDELKMISPFNCQMVKA